ncbi:MAG: sigma-54-dependent Fis family transcriptional regulator [Bacteroides sp.]|nr:sigma-54-dependent Fis family transcriptional regulator [Bacteroides sp.]
MILIVDDNQAVLASLRLLFEREGFEVVTASGPEEALATVRVREPELIMLDMNFSRATTGEEGLHLLRQVRIFCPQTPVVLMTAWANVPLAVEGMKAGAADFITKPWNNYALMERMKELISLPRRAPKGFDRSLIIGQSPAMLTMLETLERVAATDATVLITGENGTGKELVAETIHRNSARSLKPLVKVNLGGVPVSLFESEMFGHKKGAFTGAVADRKGRFTNADGGTIFLDEIGELDPVSQVKMLRVLQEKTFEPLGSSKPVKVDVRVISATNADLTRMVSTGIFREDLFYRLNLITIHLPALRERPEDIPLLVNKFAEGRAEFTADALELMKSLSWPGNIRELKNMVERAIIIAREPQIDSRLLRRAIGSVKTARERSEEAEREEIVNALAIADGKIARAAALLNISRPTLYRKIEKFDIKI